MNMKGRDFWYKRFPRRFLDATADMSFDLRCQYSVLLDVFYVHGPLRNDDRWIAFELRCDVRKWKNIRASLFAAGKLRLGEDGRIHNDKADEVIAERADKLSRRPMAKGAKLESIGTSTPPSTPASTTPSTPATTHASTTASTQGHLNKISHEYKAPMLSQCETDSPDTRASQTLRLEEKRDDRVETVDLSLVPKQEKNPDRLFFADAGTDGAFPARLPFAEHVIRELVGLGVEIEKLVADYHDRTQGRRIKDPSSYLLIMGRREAAKSLGTSVKAIAAMAIRNRSERASAMGKVVGAFQKPSASALKSAARYRTPAEIDEALKRIKERSFTCQQACDKAFDAEFVVMRFAKKRAA